MNFPEFFAAVPRLITYDPLAELLGAGDGIIEYGYADAVRLAGHSCPTVAGAYLMTHKALAALYPDGQPQRGGVRVELAAAQGDGTAGVTGSVAGLLTGAAGEGGFKGLGGQHSRRHLLHFGVAGCTDVRFTRLDTGLRIACQLDLSRIPVDPAIPGLLGSLLQAPGALALRQQFASLWQERVRRILHAGQGCISLRTL